MSKKTAGNSKEANLHMEVMQRLPVMKITDVSFLPIVEHLEKVQEELKKLIKAKDEQMKQIADAITNLELRIIGIEVNIIDLAYSINNLGANKEEKERKRQREEKNKND